VTAQELKKAQRKNKYCNHPKKMGTWGEKRSQSKTKNTGKKRGIEISLGWASKKKKQGKSERSSVAKARELTAKVNGSEGGGDKRKRQRSYPEKKRGHKSAKKDNSPRRGAKRTCLFLQRGGLRAINKPNGVVIEVN